MPLSAGSGPSPVSSYLGRAESRRPSRLYEADMAGRDSLPTISALRCPHVGAPGDGETAWPGLRRAHGPCEGLAADKVDELKRLGSALTARFGETVLRPGADHAIADPVQDVGRERLVRLHELLVTAIDTISVVQGGRTAVEEVLAARAAPGGHAWRRDARSPN